VFSAVPAPPEFWTEISGVCPPPGSTKWVVSPAKVIATLTVAPSALVTVMVFVRLGLSRVALGVCASQSSVNMLAALQLVCAMAGTAKVVASTLAAIVRAIRFAAIEDRRAFKIACSPPVTRLPLEVNP
jgi:hypothetical protein